MRSRPSKPLMWFVLIVGTLVLGFISPGTVIAQQEQQDICHMEENGTYRLITIADAAIPAHRAHGDGAVGDLVPGAEEFRFAEDCTLDERCRCEGVTVLGAIWDDTFQTERCGAMGGFITRSGTRAAGDTHVILDTELFNGQTFCVLRPRSFAAAVSRALTAAQVAICNARLSSIAAQDNVTCP